MSDPVRILLARINLRLTELRQLLGQDHRLLEDAPAIQKERDVVRQLANLLHVERATAHGRVHGTWFATLDEQREWLASMEQRTCRTVARYAGLPDDMTLARLRAAEIQPLTSSRGEMASRAE